MNIYLGSDHAGFELKEHIKNFLTEKGYTVVDCGAQSYNKEDDYPDFVGKASGATAAEKEGRGIVFGKSGTGEAIVANKVKHIRAVVGYSKENVFLSREHNDCNVLSLGSAFVTPGQAEEFVLVFLETPFSNEERHKRRIEKIKQLENS